MSRKYKIRDQNALYFVTFTVINWLDAYLPVGRFLLGKSIATFFWIAFRYCQKHKGLEVCAYCIMSSHIHMIIGRHGESNLEDIIRDIKKYTSTMIIQAIKSNSQESRRELFLWLFERAGKANSNNTNFHLPQSHRSPGL